MVTTISRDELWEKIERGDDFTLVETLPRDVYEGGHLPGALNLPFASEEEIPDLARGLLPDKDAEIVLYCGGRL
jgi:rhodanese-related sulfurtransferase